MWPWVLGSAALGGLQAYQKSGGDIGKTLTGAALGGGLGALVPGVGRFAGTALEGTGLLSPLASGLTSAATKGRQLAGLVGPAQAITPAQLSKLAGAGAMFAAGSAVPAVAAGLSGAAPSVAQGAARLGGGVAGMGVGQQQPSGAFDTTGAIPGELPVTSAPANVFDVLDPSGRFAAGRMAELKEGDVQLENMKKLMPYLFKAAEARSKTEMQRQLTAAGVRQNIATAANMLERSQQAAQQMGLNTASQMGSALTSQYQYS
jgi:hypothetical protein